MKFDKFLAWGFFLTLSVALLTSRMSPLREDNVGDNAAWALYLISSIIMIHDVVTWLRKKLR